MSDETPDKVWNVSAATNPFAEALAKEYVTEDLRRALQDVDVLLVPRDGFREHDGPLFPVGTEELLQAFRDRAGTLRADVAVEDADYRELALHADVLTIATVVVTAGVVPIVVDVIGEFIKRRIWKQNDDRVVRAEILVTRSRGDETQSARITYDGPADGFSKSMAEAVAALRIGDSTAGVQLAAPEKPALPASTDKQRSP
jgi:hypothetical protein